MDEENIGIDIGRRYAVGAYSLAGGNLTIDRGVSYHLRREEYSFEEVLKSKLYGRWEGDNMSITFETVGFYTSTGLSSNIMFEGPWRIDGDEIVFTHAVGSVRADFHLYSDSDMLVLELRFPREDPMRFIM